jgi:hypothetical protein
MCTVTFYPRKKGYALAMNRDEQLTRPQGLAPRVRREAGHELLSPSEPGGGTWIAVNDTGATLALINWYSIPGQLRSRTVSRGKVISSAGAAQTPDQVTAAIKQLPLARINPFRLIGVFPAKPWVVEWRWDLKELKSESHHWRPQQWISSGFDEPTAQKVRSRTFARASRYKTAGGLEWLRRLHRNHKPASGPFSTCMHRADAATVSYTEVVVTPSTAVMRYHAGAPCGCGPLAVQRFSRPKN